MMTTVRRVKGTAVPMPLGVAQGVLVSVLITCGLAGVVTWLALKNLIGEAMLGYAIMGILLFASIAGGTMAAIKIKRRWMLVCCLTGGGYYLFLLVLTAVFFGGQYLGVGVTGLLILCGSVGSGMLGVMRRGYREKHYKKYRTC